jgi:hypothetical protein
MAYLIKNPPHLHLSGQTISALHRPTKIRAKLIRNIPISFILIQMVNVAGTRDAGVQIDHMSQA